MTRRSSRLLSGGYYNSDEESDSSSVTNISYRENPVKVFKKKAGNRKSGSRTSSRANSHEGSPGAESSEAVAAGLGASPSSAPEDGAMRTVPYISSAATPRPALTPSSARGQEPPCRHLLPLQRSGYTGPSGGGGPGLRLRATGGERSQSGVDSSGYSSSEGTYRSPGLSAGLRGGALAPARGYRSRIGGACADLMEFLSAKAAAGRSWIRPPPAPADIWAFGGRVKKASCLFLLGVAIILCLWLLPPLLPSFISCTKAPSHPAPRNLPDALVAPAPCPPLHQADTRRPTPVLDPALVSAAVEERMKHLVDPASVSAAVQEKVELLVDPASVSAAVQEKMEQLVDPASVSAAVQEKLKTLLDPASVSAAMEEKMRQLVDPGLVSAAVEEKMKTFAHPTLVSAAVEEKMKKFLEELQKKQEHLLFKMEQMKLDVQGVRAGLEVVESGRLPGLQEELSRSIEQMEVDRGDGRSVAADLRLRIQVLEAQNAKVSQELSDIRRHPSPGPGPGPGPEGDLRRDPLTPELQQAMEKWLLERIRVREGETPGGGGGCASCVQPIANKMADFALETQGASVISTRCSETYRTRSACITLFGFPLWYPSESPRTAIQGQAVLLPGKCWAFHGVQGTLVISLSHPITITHVTLDHLPRLNSPSGRIDSAPKDFRVYAMRSEEEQGTLLGTFTYDEDGESSQTFQLPAPSPVVYRVVELHVLSNWGHVEYTCLYRFRVHGKMASA